MDPSNDHMGDASPASSGGQDGHIRAYQACLACRERKVKCDMGPVDAPLPPPCKRCRREGKACEFSSSRRKTTEAPADPLNEDNRPLKRSRSDSTRTNNTASEFGRPRAHSNAMDGPLTPTGSFARQDSDDEDPKAAAKTIADLQKLSLDNSMSDLRTVGKDSADFKLTGTASLHAAATASMMSAENVKSPSIQAHALWSKVRFVQAGWISAAEGAAIVEYFYNNLLPLTPVTIPDYQHADLHGRLLAEEPFLSVTILAIASRYYKPQGHGAQTRSSKIHDQLWKQVRTSVNRLLWGQELARNKNGDANSFDPEWSKTNVRGNLRSLGAIESLLLLTEWHCRSLHFPPTDGWFELLVGDDSDQLGGAGSPGRRERKLGDWYDPVWRSQRMSWSLISLANALGVELGVYDELTNEQRAKLENDGKADLITRKENVRHLLYIYVTQTSNTFASQCLPKHAGQDLFYTSGYPIEQVVDFDLRHPQLSQQLVLYFWCVTTKLIEDVTETLFGTREQIRDLIEDGLYTEEIGAYLIQIDVLRKELNDCKDIPKPIRHILNIEVEYLRVKISAVALKAIIWRVADKARRSQASGQQSPTETGEGQTKPFTPESLRKLCSKDRVFIEHIVRGGQNVLRSVVEDMQPIGSLHHAPVRVYFRVIHVAMALLNCFAMGQTGIAATTTLALLDKATHSIQKCIVDDIHVGTIMAAKLSVLTNRVRKYLLLCRRPKGSTNETADARQIPRSARRPSARRTSNVRPQVGVREHFTSQNPQPAYSPNTEQSQPMPTQNAFAAVSEYGPSMEVDEPNLSGMPSAMMHNYGHASDDYGGQHPLQGISVQDPSNANVSFVGPPPMSPHMAVEMPAMETTNQTPPLMPQDNQPLEQDTPAPGFEPYSFGVGQDWVALPMDPFLEQPDVNDNGIALDTHDPIFFNWLAPEGEEDEPFEPFG